MPIHTTRHTLLQHPIYVRTTELDGLDIEWIVYYKNSFVLQNVYLIFCWYWDVCIVI